MEKVNYKLYKYDFTVKNKEILGVKSENGEKKFKYPVTGKSNKLYFICINEKIVYVGITVQPIRNRLRMGVKPNVKTGYHGYKWLNNNGQYKIIICLFDEDVHLEGIEAEVIYNYRKDNEEWPAYQNEIHFHNVSKGLTDLSIEIYHSIKAKIKDSIK